MCACALAGCLTAAAASAASAATFYVDGKGKSTTCLGSSEAAACPTVEKAMLAALLSPKPNTIEVAPDGPVGGTYDESIDLENVHNGELTINGEAPGVQFVVHGAEPAVFAVGAAGAVTLSNLKVKTEGGDPAATVQGDGATLTLDDVEVENESSSGVNGIDAMKGGGEAGLVTMTGGSVVMANGAGGWAVLAHEAPVAIDNATVTDEGQSEAGGIRGLLASLSVAHSSVHVEATFTPHAALVADQGSASFEADSVTQESEEPGVQLLRSMTNADGLEVAMRRTGSKMPGVEAEGDVGTLAHLTVGGTWSGVPLTAEGSNLALVDSRLVANGAGRPAALESSDETELVVQRTVLEAAREAMPATLDVTGGNATVDSSEILGGTAGVLFDNSEEGTRTLTLAASTIATTPGIGLETPGVVGVDAEASGTHASVAKVSIEGSILLESQLAKAAAGDATTVACAYSAVPSQIQTASSLSHAGEIACPSGSDGNTNSSSELASLFAEPLHNYKLSPSSSAVDSVPVAAITLPFGLTPSTTDLEGNPRFESVACNLVQDKGALELPGHGTPCPTATTTTASTTTTTTASGPSAPSAKPLKAVLSSLSISPSAFLAAPSGATITAATAKKKKYGANITYRDSQVATTTFSVLRPTSGRMQGKSCKKPSKKNKHGKRCKLYVTLGGFTHSDSAGAISLHFSGRLKGKRLAPGSYRLQAVARDAAGSSAAVAKSFTIK